MEYLKRFTIKNQKLLFPTFFPDATRAVVRTLDSEDLEKVGIEGVIVNTYHLMSQPGTRVIEKIGGIKRFMNYHGWVISDSGGFQILSLVYKNKKHGNISDKGVTFHWNTKKGKQKINFTPEKSIQVQFKIKTDVMICLDDCPAYRAKENELQLSVKRTIDWAKRCKEEYHKQRELSDRKESERPHLLAVVQGGNSAKLREKCAQELIKIGFDGYGFGGWPLDQEGNLDLETLKIFSKLTPDHLPRFALGIGTPQDIVECFKLGYQIFDCVLPTRDARHKRLYVFPKEPEQMDLLNEKKVFDHLYILREKYVRDPQPISEFCDCYTCTNYSRSYLHHLAQIDDSLSWRLFSLHNLRTYSRLIEQLRKLI